MQKFKLRNLACADCAFKIEKAVSELDSVDSVSVNFSTGTMHIDTEHMEQVIDTVRSIEPEVQVVREGVGDRDGEPTSRIIFSRELLTIAASVAIFLVGLTLKERLHATPLSLGEYGVFLTVYALSGWRVLYLAGRKIVGGNLFDEHFLMSIATIGAIAIHALPEAAGVMILRKS